MAKKENAKTSNERINDMELRAISTTQINTYLICPRRYYYQHVEKLPTIRSAPLVIGVAFHNATESNSRQKIDTHTDLPVDHVLDMFSTEYDQADFEYHPSENPGKTKDSGIAILKKYQMEISPRIQPVEAEERFYVSFKNRPYQYTGKIDVVTAGLVIDRKTTGTNYTKIRFAHWLQIVAYTMAYRLKMVRPDTQAEVHYCVRKATPIMNCYPVRVLESDEQHFLSVMNDVARAIQLEVWPANRTANLCSRRYCSYWGQCEIDCRGTVKA